MISTNNRGCKANQQQQLIGVLFLILPLVLWSVFQPELHLQPDNRNFDMALRVDSAIPDDESAIRSTNNKINHISDKVEHDKVEHENVGDVVLSHSPYKVASMAPSIANTDAPTTWDCQPQHCKCRLNCDSAELLAKNKPLVEIVIYTRSWFIGYSKDMYPIIPGTMECPRTQCKVTYGPTFQPTTDVLLMVHNEFPAKRTKEKLRPDQIFAMINLEPLLVPGSMYKRGRVDVLLTHQSVPDFPHVIPIAYEVGSEARLRQPIRPFSERSSIIPVWISNADRVGYNRLGLVTELARWGFRIFLLLFQEEKRSYVIFTNTVIFEQIKDILKFPQSCRLITPAL